MARPRMVSGSSIVGRVDVLESLSGLLDRVCAGRSSSLLVCGEAGVGKTAVAREVATEAARRRARVVWSQAWEGAAGGPYWPWVDVVRALVDQPRDSVVHELPTTLAVEITRLVAGDELGRSVEDAGQSRLRLFEAVRHVVQRAAADAPLVVVLDDLHSANEPALLLLSYVARRLLTERVLLLGTVREPADNVSPGTLGALRELQRRAEVLTIRGLSVDETGALVHRVTGREHGAATVRALHQRTAGNPFFIRELARLEGAGDEPGALPEGIRDLIERRLACLPPDCVELLRAAAMVGRQIDLWLLSAVTRKPPADLLPLLDVAVQSRVLACLSGAQGPYQFTHDLFQEALSEGLSGAQRAQLHLAIGDALAAVTDPSPARVSEIAHHMHMALPLAQPERVAELCEQAGTMALSQLAYEDAARWYGLALDAVEISPPSVGRARRLGVLLRLADAQRRAGRRAEATAAYERALETARHEGRDDAVAEATLGIDAMAIASYTDDPARRALLSTAIGAASSDSSPRARLLAALARLEVHAGMRWGDPEVLALAEDALATARNSGDPATVALSLLALHDVIWHPTTAHSRIGILADMTQAATAAGDLERLFEAHMLRLAARLELGESVAELELQRMTAIAREAHQPRLHYYVLSRQAMWAMLRGEAARAAQMVDEAHELGQAIGEPDAERATGAQQLAMLLDQGREPWTLPIMGQMGARPTGRPALDTLRLGILKMHEGDREVAADAFARATEDLDFALRGNVAGAYTALLTEALVALGLTEPCRRLYHFLTPWAGLYAVTGGAVAVYGSYDDHLGRLAAAVGDTAAAIGHLEAALVGHRRLGARAWTARSQVTLGELLAHADPARARRVLEEGHELALSLGLTWLTDRAAAALNRSSGGIEGPLLRRRGSVWTIQYGAETLHLKHSKGLQDLARLIESPGEDVHVSELVGLADAGADAVLDDAAKAAYRRRLADLDEEIEDAEASHDLERAAQARDERAALLDELEAAVGLGGRDRRLGDPVERARKAVAGRVRDAIARISEQHEALGRHLADAVRTGAYCSYRPEA